MTDHIQEAPGDTTSGIPHSHQAGSLHHPLGAGVGAVLAAGSVGATGGLLVGPVGAIVGAVVGAVAGGLGGRAIAELVESASDEDRCSDTYESRIHIHSQSPDNANGDEMPSDSDVEQAPRETWSRLDQSSKDLLTDSPPASLD